MLAGVDAVRAALNPDGGDADLGSAAGMSDTQLGAACVEADTEVIGRVYKRYPTLPDPGPPLLVSIAVDIAAYLATLTVRRGDPLLRGIRSCSATSGRRPYWGRSSPGTSP